MKLSANANPRFRDPTKKLTQITHMKKIRVAKMTDAELIVKGINEASMNRQWPEYVASDIFKILESELGEDEYTDLNLLSMSSLLTAIVEGYHTKLSLRLDNQIKNFSISADSEYELDQYKQLKKMARLTNRTLKELRKVNQSIHDIYQDSI
jgi:hypothetical protein